MHTCIITFAPKKNALQTEVSILQYVTCMGQWKIHLDGNKCNSICRRMQIIMASFDCCFDPEFVQTAPSKFFIQCNLHFSGKSSNSTIIVML
mmetsp:Transcript_1402/g.2618  ORF Transcript_1402/g.2618 Transcript_1402/m.2618 type:complete len:92 (-) Transcript_1402:135-410(-)